MQINYVCSMSWTFLSRTKRMRSCAYRDPHYKHKRVRRPSPVHNGNPHTNKTMCIHNASKNCIIAWVFRLYIIFTTRYTNSVIVASFGVDRPFIWIIYPNSSWEMKWHCNNTYDFLGDISSSLKDMIKLLGYLATTTRNKAWAMFIFRG